MQRRTHPFLAWLSAIVYGIAVLAPAQGLVLCTGPDGHVALEAESVEGDCTGCVAEPSPSSPAPSAGEPLDGCPCVDVPLIASTERDNGARPAPRGTLELPAAPVPVAASGGWMRASRAVHTIRAYAGRPPPSAAVHRVSVLLS